MKKKKIQLGIPEFERLNFEVFKTTKKYPVRKSVYKKGITMTLGLHFGGYHIVFNSKKGQLSAVFHQGSYGREDGLWEIMPQKAPKSWGSSVLGFLTFNQVIKYVDKLL